MGLTMDSGELFRLHEERPMVAVCSESSEQTPVGLHFALFSLTAKQAAAARGSSRLSV